MIGDNFKQSRFGKKIGIHALKTTPNLKHNNPIPQLGVGPVCNHFILLFLFGTTQSGDADFEAGTNAKFAFYIDPTFVSFGNILADTESEAATPFVS